MNVPDMPGRCRHHDNAARATGDRWPLSEARPYPHRLSKVATDNLGQAQAGQVAMAIGQIDHRLVSTFNSKPLATGQ
jgi:hypothetical protein